MHEPSIYAELEDTIENLQGVDIPTELHLEYLELLAEAEETNDKFIDKIESILCLIQSRKRWLEIRKASIAPLHLLREDAKSYPQQYQKVTIEVDKKALKEAVIKGDKEALKYAELGEKSTYLSIK